MESVCAPVLVTPGAVFDHHGRGHRDSSHEALWNMIAALQNDEENLRDSDDANAKTSRSNHNVLSTNDCRLPCRR